MHFASFLKSVFICIFSLLVIFYNFFDITAANNISIKNTQKVSVLSVDEIKTEIKSEEKEVNNETKKEESTTQVSSSSYIAGNILKQTINPYNSAHSGNVYIKNSTGESIDIASLLNAKLSFEIKENDEPQVLILHTHATESFMETDAESYTSDFSSRTTNEEKNMIKVGKIIEEKLNSAGIKTVHSTEKHDYPQYSGSYTRAKATINSYLKKYPSIKVIIDLHRDAIMPSANQKVKLIKEINGKNAAQVMLVMGSNTGTVTTFPKWKENLKLAFKLQNKLEAAYPGLARPVSIVSKVYNENLSTGSLLIEFGTDANSLDEVFYSAELVGNALINLLKEI